MYLLVSVGGARAHPPGWRGGARAGAGRGDDDGSLFVEARRGSTGRPDRNAGELRAVRFDFETRLASSKP
jgi:hypothetical protein